MDPGIDFDATACEEYAACRQSLINLVSDERPYLGEQLPFIQYNRMLFSQNDFRITLQEHPSGLVIQAEDGLRQMRTSFCFSYSFCAFYQDGRQILEVAF